MYVWHYAYTCWDLATMYICSNNILICLPVLLGSSFDFFSAVLGDDFATAHNANLKLLTEGLIL